MRKVRITTGLSCLMAFILCFVIFGSNLAMSYDTVVNGMLGVQTSKVINDESVEDEDTIYYKSAYGDINAKRALMATSTQKRLRYSRKTPIRRQCRSRKKAPCCFTIRTTLCR